MSVIETILGERADDGVGAAAQLLRDFNLEYDEPAPPPDDIAARLEELIWGQHVVVLLAREHGSGTAVGVPEASVGTVPSHASWATASGGENRWRKNAARSAWPLPTAPSQLSHICESWISALVASEAARPASLRSIAEADCASDWAPLHSLAWKDAQVAATAATARMIAVHESRIRWRRSHRVSGSGGTRSSPRTSSTTSPTRSSRLSSSLAASVIAPPALADPDAG